jgi:hypothetical protein
MVGRCAYPWCDGGRAWGRGGGGGGAARPLFSPAVPPAQSPSPPPPPPPHRTHLITSLPSHTMATTGPDDKKSTCAVWGCGGRGAWDAGRGAAPPAPRTELGGKGHCRHRRPLPPPRPTPTPPSSSHNPPTPPPPQPPHTPHQLGEEGLAIVFGVVGTRLRPGWHQHLGGGRGRREEGRAALHGHARARPTRQGTRG